MCSELEAERRRGSHRQSHRPGDRSLFLRDQAQVDPGQRARRARPRRARRTGIRHDGQLADLAPDQRQTPRHRHDQRVAHAAVQHRAGRVGSGAAADLRYSRQPAAEGGVVQRAGGRGDDDAGTGRRGHCRNCRRSAGGAVRPVVLERGGSEEYLRHGLLPAAEHRHAICALEAPADYHPGGERGAAAGVRAWREHLYRRGGGAVAARQPAH